MIAEIRLQQYRSYLDQTFKLQPGLNIVIGPNASGKTNLLEALIVACQGSSYRAADAELVMHDKSWARIDVKTSNNEPRVVKINQTNELTTKEFNISNSVHKRLGSTNRLPVVLFEPNHLALLSGSPELRRNYLDSILEQIKPGYKKTKNDYLKNLKQRNVLLKSGRATPNDMFPWNVRLSQLGGVIASSRTELTLKLNENINNIYRQLSKSKKQISLSYISTIRPDNYESQLLTKYEQSYEIDLARGFTVIGPHREDLAVKINTRPVTDTASRGENRTIIVAMKMLEIDNLNKTLGTKPIVLLDDVFSELDRERQDLLVAHLNNQQVLITTTEVDNIESLKDNQIINTTASKKTIKRKVS